MKDLLHGFIVMIFAMLFSLLMFTIGTIYSLIKSIILSVTLKDWKAFFKFWWRTIDGSASAVGYLFYQVAYSLDLAWNVNGEIIEDIVTKEEDTEFGKKNVPVSASIGKLEKEEKLIKRGKIVSYFLNIIFWEKNHCIDSWDFLKSKKELREKYFDKKEI